MDFSGFFDAIQLTGNLIVEIMEWFDTHIYQFVKETFAEWIVYFAIAQLNYELWILTIAAESAITILDQLDMKSLVNDAFSQLDPQLLSLLTYLRVIEGLNVVITAISTRFVWSLIK